MHMGMSEAAWPSAVSTSGACHAFALVAEISGNFDMYSCVKRHATDDHTFT